ncbi:DUF6265 family protein [Muriicola sp. Z0-33]|uniref:DUF6265 family protein n=1 Tax=Muriicola sp. Z0-33 TaxID=2816957 RepID=UPI002237D2BA|nr:DUF6265 family protein [Muriicola sp. Z0-33]MCW5517780.1 hypothetical protein [Muriicola sp. Z0-33]
MKYLLSVFFLIAANLSAQNTLALKEGSSSPKASLSEVEWIEGHWKGEAFGGITEEIWSPPLGGSMMFVFKLVADGKVQFYEAGHIQEINETLLLQLKHFHGNFKGWEKKDETVDFKLVKVEKDRIYFSDFTFEKVSENEMNIYVVIGDEEGSTNEVKFNYKK